LEENISNGSSVNTMGEHILDSSGSGKGEVAGCCVRGNELSGAIKCWEFLDKLRKC
jgi:hypothetical protein